ncbi:MFS transporter [Desulfosporosinus sp. PR]|uniref:MFS transporter n=1 Tax=Candidatus Desulfosporosinus nitrosoreducens TaxID=3401928 RepID=UPI0027F60538|nr:MFS transporter [Desulfosporosinus sp. PR]MDQ7092599.1 MFS transporter [Desulfosporosinus sp. PR]
MNVTESERKFNQGEFVNEVAARIDRLPTTWFTYKICILAGLAFIAEAFDIGLTGSTLVPMQAIWRISHFQLGLLSIASTLGIVVGLIPAGVMVDRYGRKIMMIAGVIIQCVFTMAAALSHGVMMVVVMRFLAGFGQAAVFPTPVAYISEYAPPASRGSFISLVLALLYFTYPLPPFVSSLIIKAYPAAISWKIMFLTGGIPLLFVIPMVIWLPESVRWLAKNGQVERAQKTLVKIEQEVSRRAKKPLPEYVVENLPFNTESFPWWVAFSRKYLKRTIILDIMYSGTFIFWYVLLVYGPTFSVRQGLSSAAALRFNSYLFMACAVGALIMGIISDRFGRKIVIGVYALLGSLGLILFVFHHSTTAAILITGAMIGGFGLGVFPACKAYIAEQYPTEVRGRGVFSCEAVSRFVGGVLFVYLVTYLMDTIGVNSIYTIMAIGFVIMTGVVTVIFGNETKSVSVDSTETFPQQRNLSN